jgi:hypothetical protein
MRYDPATKTSDRQEAAGATNFMNLQSGKPWHLDPLVIPGDAEPDRPRGAICRRQNPPDYRSRGGRVERWTVDTLVRMIAADFDWWGIFGPVGGGVGIASVDSGRFEVVASGGWGGWGGWGYLGFSTKGYIRVGS